MPPQANRGDVQVFAGPRVTVLIAAWNEAERIGETLRALAALTANITQILVVDDGSTDSTVEVARASGATRVISIRHAGKGAALMAGIPLIDEDTALLLDADLGKSVAAVAELLRPIEAGEADLAIAILPGSGGPRRGRGMVVRLARWGIRRLTGFTAVAPLSGQRAIRRCMLPERLPRGWGVEVAATIDALRRGARVVEVEADFTHRVTGNSVAGWRHRARQFVDVSVAVGLAALPRRRRSRGANKQ
ncbi:MAG: glycosyltransferase family 2 protein [Armatimonadetes bacterium]|nr:glycosyltransferase family 2 protein [Armatimonadota bacterium]MDE2206939.1 glycosyltransferase family 2 protein [Armatimonadota bacterium]